MGNREKPRKYKMFFCFHCSSITANLQEAEAYICLYITRTSKKYFHFVFSFHPCSPSVIHGHSWPQHPSDMHTEHTEHTASPPLLGTAQNPYCFLGLSIRKISTRTALKLFVSIVVESLSISPVVLQTMLQRVMLV